MTLLNSSMRTFSFADYSKESLARLLPWLAAAHSSGAFTAADLRACIRVEFRKPCDVDKGEQMDRAFTSLKVLEEQLYMAQCSSSATTNKIRVDVTSAFIGVRSAAQIQWRCAHTLM